MPLYRYKESELRQFFKDYIESLELWLRRIINDTLSENYGVDYFECKNLNNENIISKDTRTSIKKRREHDPGKFARQIDACLLDDEIKIITKYELYGKHFKAVFENAFPQGVDVLRNYLNRLVSPRNQLYHANPISVRDAERIICYSNDIIDAIKEFYMINNMNNEFNVPLILKYSDSLGNIKYRDQFYNPVTKTVIVNLNNLPFRPGDRFSCEIEIDSSFSKNDYNIEWTGVPSSSLMLNKLNYMFRNEDIGERFNISCKIISKKAWHRLNGHDDMLSILLKVLPPV